MSDAVPKFRDIEPRGFKRPAFARDLDALGDDILAAIADVPSESGPSFDMAQQTTLLTIGKPHPAIGGLTIGADAVDLQTNYDFDAEGDSLWADAKDERLYRAVDPAGAATIDIAEIVGLAIAHYAGHNNNYDDSADAAARRDVYLTHEPTRVFVLAGTGNGTTELGPNQWWYKGWQVRMKRPPRPGANNSAELGVVWEIHPEAQDGEPVDLFNFAELGNTDALAGGLPIDEKFTGVNLIAGIVTAVRRSYPAYSDGGTDYPAGVCWWFHRENAPIVDCEGEA